MSSDYVSAAVGRVVRAVASDGTAFEYEYDGRGDLVKVIDPEENETEYAYDDEHNLIDIKDGRGVTPIRNEYDDAGRLIAHTDADGNRIEYTHSEYAKQEVVLDRLGRISIYEYDDWGMVTAVTDPTGATTRSEYGLIGGGQMFGGRLMPEYRVKTADMDAAGNRTEYGYDAWGNMTSRTDALGHTQTWRFDEDDQLIAETDALGRTTRYEYDDKGHKIAQTDAMGNETRWEITRIKGLFASFPSSGLGMQDRRLQPPHQHLLLSHNGFKV